MTIRRKMIIANVAGILSLFILAGLPLYTLLSLQGASEHMLEEFEELMLVKSIQSHVISAQKVLEHTEPGIISAINSLQRASQVIRQFEKYQESEESAGDEHQSEEVDYLATGIQHIDEALKMLKQATTSPENINVASIQLSISNAALAMENLSNHAHQAAARSHRHVTHQVNASLSMLAILSPLIVIVFLLITFWVYQSVVTPLTELQAGVNRIASGDFENQIKPVGDLEFKTLTQDFNHMGNELKRLYHDLEDMVESKSRELVQSERLASVGYLAAGVAHEINNPLGIISGYAELSMREVEQLSNKVELKEIPESLKIINDEAFRCKAIVEKLLALSRMNSSERELVIIVDVVQEVVEIIQGLEKYNNRKLILENQVSECLQVHASAAELKQVMLNLTVNALESTMAGKGRVVITTKRVGSTVEIDVADNGCGMTEETIQHIFEPFYSQSQPTRTQGTGLGLSITHAIVQSHYGTIRATSAGLNKGSTFTIKLPIYDTGSENNG